MQCHEHLEEEIEIGGVMIVMNDGVYISLCRTGSKLGPSEEISTR